MTLTAYIQKITQIPTKGLEATIKLLNEDCTLPFIARYRKELTGNLDEVAIADIIKYKKQFETIEKRKESILKALQEQGVLSDDLKRKINSTQDLSILEDIYLPFKKKRKTKADTARKNGLEPLAKTIMAQRSNTLKDLALKYTNKEVSSPEDALEGARHIIAEWVNERSDVRSFLRKQYAKKASIASSVIKIKKDDEKAQKYRDYFNWDEPLTRCPSHRLLAILRAESEGFIRLKIAIDEESARLSIEDKIINSDNACADEIAEAIEDAYKRLLAPSLSKEALKLAKEKADNAAITVFAKNLQQLLLGAPLGEKSILALDPGFRSGCKLVCLDARGDIQHNENIYPHAPQNQQKEAIKRIQVLVKNFDIEVIAIGNGTASRETEAMVKSIAFDRDIDVFVVSEAGASIYSASKIARDEFPDYDVTVRGAISIGRRLADPLAELVKIDAKSIGVGQYQHDVDQTLLNNQLDTVVEHCVNKVGVNINTASTSLLSYVSGIGPKLAENIVAYRGENGAFKSRSEIKKVKRLGAKAFEQGAGFLRIKNGKNPLDDSAVHPESYAIVKQMAKDSKLSIADLIGNSKILNEITLRNYCTDSIGLPTLNDIVAELKKPGLDPREKAKTFSFNEHIHTIDDLTAGMILPGIINNITNFGCFVDIGIKESGLVHISNVSNTFVSDINTVVNLQQQVMVKVLEVDTARKRVQLSMNFTE
ncbi:MAG: RNA-binding transcriptional accessory protein [Flavobacteriaceae bacterium]|nr:MAG: RNA-binding transcriptional accessory protein [Flavobacteriaceae bacterium]